MNDVPAYGLWVLVLINSLVFIIFAFSFTKPSNPRDWRSFTAFSAFIVALFTEMYGVPLTIYVLSGWLQSRYPDLDPLSHDAGHLWWTIFGLGGNPHFNPIHLLSSAFILGGFILLSAAWRVLHKAQQQHKLAVAGAYSQVRHPQYDAFVLIMVGFLLQWPTILTILMFPFLVWMYVRLAHEEEREALADFGEGYARYAAKTPAFFPNIRNRGKHSQNSPKS